MAIYFFDSSALAMRYGIEPGTARVQTLMDPTAGNGIYAARITLVELISAITRRQRAGDLTQSACAAALTDLRADFVSDYAVIEITVDLIAQAGAMAEKQALRGYDAVQLAAALQANSAFLTAGMLPLTLVSADLDLNKA